jgi:phosphoglycerate kinase
MKKTIRDIDAGGQRVLIRADFNVPLEEGEVADDTRIRASLPTIEHLLDQDARVILSSHLGRPGGEVVEELRLDPVAARLADLINQNVLKADDCVGDEVEEAAAELKPGEVLLLENTRFHPGEKANDPDFAAQLASLADVYINDAFGTAHRAHASTEGVAHHLPAVAGLLMARELEALKQARENPAEPLVLILGGAKISDKIGVLDRLGQQAALILVGGGMANTFLKAKGLEVGKSLVEEDVIDEAQRILKELGEKLLLPVDVVIADAFETDADHRTISVDGVPSEWRILDIGPETIDRFTQRLRPARMVIWNGPMGVFEMDAFAQGTYALARRLADLDAEVIIGGGETGAAVNEIGVMGEMAHVSTGGGAFLTFMEGGPLPGVEALEDR